MPHETIATKPANRVIAGRCDAALRTETFIAPAMLLQKLESQATHSFRSRIAPWAHGALSLAIFAKQKPIEAERRQRAGDSLQPERSTDENNSLVTRRSHTAHAAVARHGAYQGPIP